jgi:hypothetical protein
MEVIGILVDKEGWQKEFHSFDFGRSFDAHGGSGPTVALDFRCYTGVSSIEASERGMRVYVSADRAVEMAECLLHWADISRQHFENGYHREGRFEGWSREEHVVNSLKPILERL